jgi:hypothetical protein
VESGVIENVVSFTQAVAHSPTPIISSECLPPDDGRQHIIEKDNDNESKSEYDHALLTLGAISL